MGEPIVSRLRRWAPVTLACVPDTDGEIADAAGRLEDLLALVHAAEEDDRAQGADPDLPAALAGDRASRAATAIASAVRAGEHNRAQPYRPDGRYQLVPLAFVHLDAGELHTMGAAVRALGASLLPGANPLVVQVLDDYASSSPGRSTGPEDLVVEAARLHGLLDLPWDDHVARLADALPAGVGDVTLSPALHDDYETVAGRVLRIWHHGDPLAPFLYRG